MNNILFKFMSTFIFSTLLFTSNLTIAETIQQKKQSFFNLVYPLIETENTSILKTRKRLTSIRNKIKEKKPITDAERNYIEILNDQYSASKNKTDINELVDKLIVKIDVIPPSLAMAQSANESAWGKSRFAVKANNFFWSMVFF